MMITIEWLIAMLCGAVLSCWTAYQSTVIQTIKDAIGMNPDLRVKWVWWFKPIGFIIDELRFLISCPYCTSFWVSAAINYFYFGFNIPTAFIYAPIGIVFVELYRKLTL